MNIKEFNNICNALKEIITGSVFENHIFCVGGCCRDEILGYEIKDIDIAEAENGLQLFARIQYTLTELDGSTGNYEIISKL